MKSLASCWLLYKENKTHQDAYPSRWDGVVLVTLSKTMDRSFYRHWSIWLLSYRFLFSPLFCQRALYCSWLYCLFAYKQQSNGYWHVWRHVPVCCNSQLISWTSHSYSSTARLSPVYRDRYTPVYGFESAHRKLPLCNRPTKIICLWKHTDHRM